MSRSALVNYPGFGSLWLQDAEVIEREDGPYVEGWVYNGDCYPWPDKDHMNFPLSCVRKWDPPLEATL